MNVHERISALRQAMQAARVEVYVVPGNDPHASEYMAAHWCEMQWLSGTHREAATQNPHCTRIYIKKADAYDRTTPVKSTELAARSRFTAVRALVKARKSDLMNISTDQANFEAQKNLTGGKKTMNAYLWKICGDEYDAQH